MLSIANSSLCKALNRINLNLLTFGYAEIDSGWNGEVMSPLFSRLYYIESGAFSIYHSQNNQLKLQKGKWYLIPAGCSFRYECNETMKHFYFHVRLSDFDGVDLLQCFKKPYKIENKNFDFKIAQKCLSSNCLTDGFLLRQTVFEVLLSFIKEHNISINKDDYSPCIFKALFYIRQNLSINLTISEIAENIFVSKSTLTKHFKRELSTTVNEYICNTVMGKAEELLVGSNISILDISQKFGFSDQFYFSRLFKKKFGKSPREYRKSHLL